MGEFRQLKQFTASELVLTKDQAVIVLKFIFKSDDHKTIDAAASAADLRGFAQGLLVEAIDASYKIGFVEHIFRASANPSKGALAIIKGFAKKASKHWFRHATAQDLMNVKIYEMVVNKLAASFRSSLYNQLAKGRAPSRSGSMLSYGKPLNAKSTVIG